MIASANPRNGSINFGSGATGVEFFPVTHIGTFQGLSTTLANTYRDYDVALRDSIDNARRMRNDCGLMECLEARQRAVALLPWTIEPEDQKSQLQKRLCREMTRILARTPRFTEFRRSLLEAIWYGKYGVKVTYNREQVRRNERFVISSGEDCPDVPAWVPINGDKIVFRHDDRSRLDASRGQYPFQVGIRVGLNWKETDAISQNDRILGKYIPEKIQSNYRGAEAVDRGMAYFLDREDRKNVIIHKHTIEDGSYEDMLSAGSIHGMGIRSRIYWDWVQLQEVTAWLIAYIERTHGGMEIYKYPLGNQAAKDEIDTMIANRAPGRSALKVPVPNGEDASQFGVEVVEAGMSGVSFLMELMKDYYGHRIKRYILGQTLSTEAGSTGLGSGVADLHLETFLQILKYDAVNFDDSMSNQVLRWLQIANFPASKGILLRYKTVTEDSEKQEKMKALQSAWEMGARVKESDVYEVCGLSAPGPNDRILQQSSSPEPQRFSRSTVAVPERYSQQWNERQHPRQDDGRFTGKGSGNPSDKFGTRYDDEAASDLVARIRAGDAQSKNKGIIQPGHEKTGPLVMSEIPTDFFDQYPDPDDGNATNFLKSVANPDRVNRYKDVDSNALPPVYVYTNRSGRHVLSDGAHRLTAAIARGDKTIRALVSPQLHEQLHGTPSPAM